MSPRPEPSPDLLSPDGWEESRGRLVAFARRRLGDADDAEDVVHEVFLRALERANALEDDGRLDAWLYQITRNVLIDRHRSRATAVRALEAYPTDARARTMGGVAEPNGEDADEARAELARCLRPLIDTLPPSYRRAVMLSELEGAPQREVAELLDLSVSGAKSRIQRGRRMLRERILACCVVERDRNGSVVDWARREGCDPGDDGDCGAC